MARKIIVMLTIALSLFLLVGCSCDIENCEFDRMDGSKYCIEHTCAEEGCNKILHDLTDPLANYCEEHYNCAVEGCEREKNKYGYCSEHDCKAEGCSNQRVGNAYCEEHFACAVSDCTNERYYESFVVHDYCSEHKCNYNGCKTKAIENKSYCDFHICLYPKCDNGRKEGLDFCEVHYVKPKTNSTTSSTNKKTSVTSAATKVYPSKLTDDQKMVLWIEAQDAVKAQLKSPSTAKFPFAINSDGVEIHYNNSLGIASIWGWVDAQNSYGATVREEWLVDFKISEDGKKYELTNIEFF